MAQLPALGEEVPQTDTPPPGVDAARPPAFTLPPIGGEVPQPPPAGGAMNFAIVNGRRVPIDEDTGEPKAPASLWEQANTSPLHKQFEAARQAITEYVARPTLTDQKLNDLAPALRLGTLWAMAKGAYAGGEEGLLNVAESYTTPIGLALTLTGLGPESAIVKAAPALKPLVSLPAVQALRAAVHTTAGAAFAAHGAGTVYDAATAPGLTPGQRLANAGQGVVEMAGGALGMAPAAQAAASSWAQSRRTAAGAAAATAFKQAVPPSVGAPYTEPELTRAFGHLVDEHQTTPIASIADTVQAADRRIGMAEQGIQAAIDLNPHELIPTRPLDAVRATLGPSVRADALDRGLAALKTLGLDQPLTVDRANAIRKQLNAENDAVLANNKYDVAVARQVDPGFAAREAAAASLRTGIHDVIDTRVGVPGFTAAVRGDQGALIAVRNAALRQLYHSDTTVGGTGTTSPGRQIAANILKLTGTGAGGAIGAAGGPWGASAGAIAGRGLAEPIAGAIDRPPLTRNALVEKAFNLATQATTPPGRVATFLGVGGPGAGSTPPPPSAPGGGPSGPGAGGVPSVPGGPAPAAGTPPLQIAVPTFLALRARGFSREQAVQMAASFARRGLEGAPPPPPFVEGEIIPDAGLPPGPPTPLGLPPLPPRQLGPGPGFVIDATGRTVPIAKVKPGALIPDNGARVPSMPPGGYRTPKTDPSFVRAAPGTYAERVAAAAPATIVADAAASPAVADQQAAAARAGLVPPDRGAQLPDAQAQRVLPPAVDTPGAAAGGQAGAPGVTPAPVANFQQFTKDALRYAADNGTPEYAAGAKAEIARRKAAAQDRADARTATRAQAAAYEQQDIADLVTKAQANGYPGDPAALHAELADRLQGIKELHAEFDDQGTNGLTLLRAIAKNGGLSVTAAEAAGQGGELRWLKEFQDTKPSASRTNLKAPPVAVSGQVRGVGGVFRTATEQTRGGRAGGQSLGGMLEALQADPRFSHITNTNELSDAIREAATGVADSRNAIKDLAATSHDLIGTATIHPEDDLRFDPVALEAESQAHAAGARARQK